MYEDNAYYIRFLIKKSHTGLNKKENKAKYVYIYIIKQLYKMRIKYLKKLSR
jgi:hypothetical protein